MAKYWYRYPDENGAAFIELKDDKMRGDELFQVLERVPGVHRVYWQTCKSDQGNHSQRKLGTPYMGVGHFLERNVFVKSKLFKRAFEFELTRSMHTRTMGTCSMAFKVAPDGQLLEAWRILRHAVGDRGLPASSIEVEKWHNYIRLIYSEQEKSVWKAVPTGAGSATPASALGASSVTLVSKAYVEETLALKKRKARPMDEGASNSTGFSSAPTFVSAADVEETLALKKKESSACGRRRFE